MADKTTMRVHRISLLFALLLPLASCATTSRYNAKVRSWDGKSATALVNSWGQPDSIEKLSSGNRMYVYARLHHPALAYGESQRAIASAPVLPASSTTPKKTGAPGAAATRAPASLVYIKCATYFEVDPQNTIVSALFRGDECKSYD